MSEAITGKLTREFAAYDTIIAIAAECVARNAERFALDPERPETQFVARIYGGARKSVDAVRLLAAAGYGEDAMRIARALVNACIDLAYVCDNDSANRVAQWVANGRVARKRMADEFGLKMEEAPTADWAKVERLAKQWRDVNIEMRAKKAGLENFYKVLFRHGSSFDHSDACALQNVLERGPEGPMLNTEPSDALVVQSLFAAYTFAQITVTMIKVFGFDCPDAETRMLDEAKRGLRFERASQ